MGFDLEKERSYILKIWHLVAHGSTHFGARIQMGDPLRHFLAQCAAVCDSPMGVVGFAPTGNHRQEDWHNRAVYREYGREQLRVAIRGFSNQHEGAGCEGIVSLRPGEKYPIGRMHSCNMSQVAKQFGFKLEAFYFPDLSDRAATEIVLRQLCADWTKLLGVAGTARLHSTLMKFDQWGHAANG